MIDYDASAAILIYSHEAEFRLLATVCEAQQRT